MGKTEHPPLFTQKIHRETNSAGVCQSEVIVRDLLGNIALRETSVLDHGTLISLKIEHFQLKEIYEVTQNGKTITYRTFTMSAGKPLPKGKGQTEQIPDSFLAGPALEDYIRGHWSELMNDETLYVQFALVDQADTIGLKLFKTNSEKNKNTETANIRMKPSSIILAAITDPVDVIFDTKKMTILKFTGRSPLKKIVNGSLKPLDVEIIYR